jgi:hypothetical protein
MNKTYVAIICLPLLCGTSQAQLFLVTDNAAFSQLPTSQLGPVIHNLVITDTTNGFTVTGQVLVNVPPGTHSGTLVEWTIERKMNPGFNAVNVSTNTQLDGFSQPPPGVFGNTSGVVESEFTNVNGSAATLNPVLTAGAAVWTNLTASNGPFSFTVGSSDYLRQTFFLDGNQINGPGGQWTIDVPVMSFVTTTVPEPTLLGGNLIAVGLLLVCRRQSRRAALSQNAVARLARCQRGAIRDGLLGR